MFTIFPFWPYCVGSYFLLDRPFCWHLLSGLLSVSLSFSYSPNRGNVVLLGGPLPSSSCYLPYLSYTNLPMRRSPRSFTCWPTGGKKTYWVDPSSVKQIGGRAGRLSSAYKEGNFILIVIIHIATYSLEFFSLQLTNKGTTTTPLLSIYWCSHALLSPSLSLPLHLSHP